MNMPSYSYSYSTSIFCHITERTYVRNMNFEPTTSSNVSPGKIVSSSEEETSSFNGNGVEGVAIARLAGGVPRDMSTSVQQEPELGQEQEEGQERDEETLTIEKMNPDLIR